MTEPVFQNTDDDEVILVVNQDGRVRRSPVPEGFDPLVFRDILAAINIYYLRNGVVPTVDEVHKSWDRIPLIGNVSKQDLTRHVVALLMNGLSVPGSRTGANGRKS